MLVIHDAMVHDLYDLQFHTVLFCHVREKKNDLLPNISRL